MTPYVVATIFLVAVLFITVHTYLAPFFKEEKVSGTLSNFRRGRNPRDNSFCVLAAWTPTEGKPCDVMLGRQVLDELRRSMLKHIQSKEEAELTAALKSLDHDAGLFYNSTAWDKRACEVYERVGISLIDFQQDSGHRYQGAGKLLGINYPFLLAEFKVHAVLQQPAD